MPTNSTLCTRPLHVVPTLMECYRDLVFNINYQENQCGLVSIGSLRIGESQVWERSSRSSNHLVHLLVSVIAQVLAVFMIQFPSIDGE